MFTELFVKINSQILTNNVKETLVNFSLSNLDLFERYPSRQYPGQFSGNDFLWSERMTPEIREICLETRKIFEIPFRYGIGKQDPGRQVLKHTDLRTAVVIIPLYPIGSFSPTLYWEREDSEIPMAKCHYDDMLPSLLNPKVLHSINNDTDNYRLALQLDLLEVSYLDARNLLESQNLLVK